MVCKSAVLPVGWLLVVGSDIRRSRERGQLPQYWARSKLGVSSEKASSVAQLFSNSIGSWSSANPHRLRAQIGLERHGSYQSSRPVLQNCDGLHNSEPRKRRCLGYEQYHPIAVSFAMTTRKHATR